MIVTVPNLFEGLLETLCVLTLAVLFGFIVFIYVLVKFRGARRALAGMSLVGIALTWIAVVVATFASGPAAEVREMELWSECQPERYDEGPERVYAELAVREMLAATLPVPSYLVEDRREGFDLDLFAIGGRWVGEYRDDEYRVVLVSFRERPSETSPLDVSRHITLEDGEGAHFLGEHVFISSSEAPGMRVLSADLVVLFSHDELLPGPVPEWAPDGEGGYWFLDGPRSRLTRFTPPDQVAASDVEVLEACYAIRLGEDSLCVSSYSGGRLIDLDPPALRELSFFQRIVDRHYASALPLVGATATTVIIVFFLFWRLLPLRRIARLERRVGHVWTDEDGIDRWVEAEGPEQTIVWIGEQLGEAPLGTERSAAVLLVRPRVEGSAGTYREPAGPPPLEAEWIVRGEPGDVDRLLQDRVMGVLVPAGLVGLPLALLPLLYVLGTVHYGG